MNEQHRTAITPLSSREAVQSRQNLENRFVLGEHVTRKDIQEYARHMASAYKREPHEDARRTLMLDALTDERIEELLAVAKDVGFDYGGLTRQEKNDALTSIRRQIVEELGLYFDPDAYVLLTKNVKEPKLGFIHNNNSVVSAFGAQGREHIYKKFGLVLDKGYVNKMMHAMEALINALDEEKKKGAPFPYIVDVEKYDTVSASTLLHKINMTTAGDEMARDTTEYTGKDLLSAVRDCILGAIFLEQHGLMLQDITTDNIGVLKDTGQGILFDLDGLYPIGKERVKTAGGEKIPIAILRDGYKPPEFSKKGHHFASTSEMVWQFGATLRSIAVKKIYKVHTALETLMYEMVKEDPRMRIGLKEAEQRLSQFIAQMKDNE